MSEKPDKKGFGSTVLGWFVVREPEPGTASVSDESTDRLIEKYANETPSQPPPEVAFQGELPRSTGGAFDAKAVFLAAGVDEAEQERIDKAMALLKTLPAETPKEVKRQIVEASLKAFGYPVDQIIEAGAQEIQALELYAQNGQRQTQALLVDSQKRIEALNAEVERVKKVMEDAVAEQYALTQSTNQHKLRIQEVLEFFGQEAIARVVKESPKLHEVPPGPERDSR